MGGRGPRGSRFLLGGPKFSLKSLLCNFLYCLSSKEVIGGAL